jgi:threonine/homoserine/homoserine lactone efflux protein
MAGSAKTGARARPLNFFEAAAFQWINPKGWVMAVAAAATYASGGAPLREAGVLAVVFLAVSLPGAQGWTLFGVGIRRMLGTGARLRAFNVTMGLLLASSALLLVLD